jgi:predicted secreted protein
MKLLKLFILLPVVAFSFELKFNKVFTKELQHDILSSYVTVSITDDNESLVSNRLEVFNKKIKENDKVEKRLGTFNIRPKYRHSSNTPKIIGYVGELRYKVNSYKANDMNGFISDLTKLKTNRDTTISVNNLSWTVKEDTFNITLDLLRLEAINWISRYSKNLSSDINKNCTVKEINISTSRSSFPVRNRMAYASASVSKSSIPVPEANQEKIKINPSYLLDCK